MTKQHGTFHDAMDAAYSDPDNPIWSTDIPGPNETANPYGVATGHPGVMTLSGIRDLMHHFETEVEDALRHAEEEGQTTAELPAFLREVLPLAPKPVWVKADIVASKRFHTDTFVIPANASGIPQGSSGGATLVSARGDRTRIVITNTGANPAYFSYDDDVDSVITTGEMAWAIIAVAGAANPPCFREIRAGGKVYVYSPLGTTIDVQEEYGYVYEEGGFETP